MLDKTIQENRKCKKCGAIRQRPAWFVNKEDDRVESEWACLCGHEWVVDEGKWNLDTFTKYHKEV